MANISHVVQFEAHLLWLIGLSHKPQWALGKQLVPIQSSIGRENSALSAYTANIDQDQRLRSTCEPVSDGRLS